MITASLALKINSYVLMAFMIGMCFFPQFMIDQYKIPIPAKEWTMMAWFMQKMGATMMLNSAVNGALARDQVPAASQSVACLVSAFAWLTFVVYDYYDLSQGNMSVGGTSVPKESIYANCALFGTITVINIMGWKDAGSALPGDLLGAFKGRTFMPLMVNCATYLSFAVGLLFSQAAFLDLYVPGYKWEKMELAMASRVGLEIIFAVLTMLAAASVGDEDVSYRLMRASVFHAMFNFGLVAADGIIQKQAGWPMDMRTFSVFQIFAVTYYLVFSFATIPVKLGAAPKVAPKAAPKVAPKASPRGKSPGRAKTPTRRSSRSKSPARR